MREWEARAEGAEGEGCALTRERAKTAHWSDPGVVRMEIRPDRFNAVAAKTLGKIYGYVKSLKKQQQQQKQPITIRKCWDAEAVAGVKRKFIFCNKIRLLEGGLWLLNRDFNEYLS